jgi:hypothetical protein
MCAREFKWNNIVKQDGIPVNLYSKANTLSPTYKHIRNIVTHILRIAGGEKVLVVAYVSPPPPHIEDTGHLWEEARPPENKKNIARCCRRK